MLCIEISLALKHYCYQIFFHQILETGGYTESSAGVYDCINIVKLHVVL